ncbi:MAG: hypothetical protein DRR19_10725 [Candidatus Parabeggiatoa sp. nov. 1]|nr:MAG: hypothetical protein DRR19_10725 [Gammaproteobacteria bacterium]
MAPQNTYDELPYECAAASRTQPTRLATVATLFGMTPPPVQTSRVLEIGCADGTNVIAMGYALPDAACLGIDASARQIEQGQALLAQLNLPNVSLQHKNILEIDANFGPFDYIIAHGVYSWVSPPVQEHILTICQHNLTPNGVAYISFNTRPGWNMRSTIRDMMLYHAQQFDDMPTQIEQMKALLKFFADATKEQKTLHSAFLQKELKIFNQISDTNWYHEFLEENNLPLYFHEFAKQVEQHGLQYLGDTEVQTMFLENLSPPVIAQLQNLSVIHQEQYFDFLNNRVFRHSLLCHQEVKLQRSLYPAVIKQFYLASQLQPVGDVDIVSDQPAKFEKAGLGGVEEDTPIVKSALVYLAKIWPQAIAFKELVQHADLQLKRDPQSHFETSQEDILAEALLKCCLGSVIEAFTHPPRCVTTISPFPKASELAQVQIQHGDHSVSNLRCEQLKLSPLLESVLPAVNGTHDEAALIEILRDLSKKGIITAQHEGQPAAPEAVTTAMLQDLLRDIFTYLAQTALLVD